MIKEEKVKFLDFRSIDLPGQWQHISFPASEYSDKMFTEGIGFDGSSIRGFQSIDKSDMLLMPDISTAFIDPFFEQKTLVFTCDIYEPETLEPYERDPRYIGRKAEKYLKSTGIADKAYFGPEPEFYIFDSVAFDTRQQNSFYNIEADDAFWATGNMDDYKNNLSHKVPYKGGYFPVPPIDAHQDLRSEMVKYLKSVGLDIEMHHHEVGTAGQAEIGLRYNTLINQGDSILKHKYVIKNVARINDKTATFMPKPLTGDNGSGMHTHCSLWTKDKNIFYDSKGYAGLSQTALYYIGGLLKHAPSVLAFAAPSTNSYRRLVPGFEAPVSLVYSKRNRSAAIRIPIYQKSPSAKRVEFRCPDPSANPYLAFTAILMAGLDGIENKIDPPPALEKDLYALSSQERSKISSVPVSLEESLFCLEQDNEYLTKGGVLSKEFIEHWIAYKRENEIEYMRKMPHPGEFSLYYSV